MNIISKFLKSMNAHCLASKLNDSMILSRNPGILVASNSTKKISWIPYGRLKGYQTFLFVLWLLSRDFHLTTMETWRTQLTLDIKTVVKFGGHNLSWFSLREVKLVDMKALTRSLCVELCRWRTLSFLLKMWNWMKKDKSVQMFCRKPETRLGLDWCLANLFPFICNS